MRFRSKWISDRIGDYSNIHVQPLVEFLAPGRTASLFSLVPRWGLNREANAGWSLVVTYGKHVIPTRKCKERGCAVYEGQKGPHR